MITYLDTSALLKLLMDEPGSDRVELIWHSADILASVTLVSVEARAALAAARRGGRLTTAQHRRARTALAAIVDDLTLVEVTEEVIAEAGDLAEAEALRGYDAVHLAAALTVEAMVLASADAALCAAARHSGLHVADPLDVG